LSASPQRQQGLPLSAPRTALEFITENYIGLLAAKEIAFYSSAGEADPHGFTD